MSTFIRAFSPFVAVFLLLGVVPGFLGLPDLIPEAQAKKYYKAKNRKNKNYRRSPRYSSGSPNARNKLCNYPVKVSQKYVQELSNVPKSNKRVPYMQEGIARYLVKLKQNCPGLKIESTFRDCGSNASARGMKYSWHLCGGGADTSGCPDATSKQQAARICKSMGFHFINEGSSRYPHCQIKSGFDPAVVCRVNMQ